MSSLCYPLEQKSIMFDIAQKLIMLSLKQEERLDIRSVRISSLRRIMVL